MSDMTAKHGNGKFQCSCCDSGGRIRRTGRRGVKQRERRQWQRDHWQDYLEQKGGRMTEKP